MTHSILPPYLAATHSLPDFRSLIVQGPYPPSAPLHLCLSHLSSGPPTQKALLLSSSSTHLSNQLEEYNDAWLAGHAGHGSVAEHLHQIDIYYPPTHQHLRLLLARLRIFSTPGVDADSETDMKICIPRAPTLVVMHELSRYFLASTLPEDSEAKDLELPTLSTYMQLVVDAITCLQFLHASTKSLTLPRLVLFDTALCSLILPIFRPVSVTAVEKLPKLHKARAADVLQRYIGWVGTVEKVEEIDSSQADEIEFGFPNDEGEHEELLDKFLFGNLLSRKASGVMYSDKFKLLIQDPRAPVVPPTLVNETSQGPHQPPPETVEQAIHRFNSLDIDWTRELSRLLELTSCISSLSIGSNSLPALELLYILQQCKPQLISSAFPRLRSLTLQSKFTSYFLTQWLVSRATVQHITFCVNFGDDTMETWKKRARICRSGSAGLRSLMIRPQKWNETGPGNFMANVIAARNWETIHLPCPALGRHVWKALSNLSGLMRVTLEGRFSISLALRLVGISSTLVEMFALARPNVEEVDINISTSSTTEDELPTTIFTPLLSLKSLSHLSVQPSRPGKTLLGDEFLQSAARSWPRLHTLDLAPHRLVTCVTLQGLASISRTYLPSCVSFSTPSMPCVACSFGTPCPSMPTPMPLRVFRVLLDPSHAHTVLSPSLYGAHAGLILGDHQSVLRMCPLRVLEVGCPPVYDGKEAAAFLRALFPALHSIEFGRSDRRRNRTGTTGEVQRMEIGEGERFAWNRVVQLVLGDSNSKIHKIGGWRQIGPEVKTEEQEVEALLCQIAAEEDLMEWSSNELEDSDELSFEHDSEADFDMDN